MHKEYRIFSLYWVREVLLAWPGMDIYFSDSFVIPLNQEISDLRNRSQTLVSGA